MKCIKKPDFDVDTSGLVLTWSTNWLDIKPSSTLALSYCISQQSEAFIAFILPLHSLVWLGCLYYFSILSVDDTGRVHYIMWTWIYNDEQNLYIWMRMTLLFVIKEI